MIPYLLHVAILISCFYLFYKVFLAKETFFHLNRWLFISSIVLSFSLPLIPIPESWSIWQQEATPTELALVTKEVPLPQEEIMAEESLPPAEAQIEKAGAIEAIPVKTSPLHLKWNIGQMIWYVYLTGLAIFFINLLIQFSLLVHQIIRLPSLRDGRYTIVELDNDQAPYSFLNYIFINPTQYEWEIYSQIIDHEKVHIRQVHSMDMILAELLVILQWFNPFAWQYRKDIENNLEFLTDDTLLDKGIDRENYQLNLLKVSVPQYPLGMVMNYNQSILKKRIKMMNAKKSSVRSSWKYLLVLPILACSMSIFNQVVAQQEVPQTPVPYIAPAAPPAPTAPSAPEAPTAALAPSNYSNPMPSPAIAPSPVHAPMPVIAPTPPSPPTPALAPSISPALAGSFNTSGFWQAEFDDNEVCIRFEKSRIKNGNGHWGWTRCFKPQEFTVRPANGIDNFSMKREAGELAFTGTIENNYGHGRYTFTSGTSLKQYLQGQGYSNLSDEYMFHLFMADITKEYIAYIKKENIDLSRKQLKEFAIHGLTLAYLQENIPVFKSKGFRDIRASKLIELKIHGVSSEYIKEMASIGFDDLSLQDLVEGRIHGVDPDYVKEIHSLGYKNLDFRDYVEFSIHGVNRDVVESLAEIGFTNLPANKITDVAIHGVSAEYIEGLRKAGYDLKNIDDLIDFKIHGVSTNFIDRMTKLGYSNLSARDIKNAAIHGVDIRTIEDLRKIGYELDINDAIELSIHGVSVSYISRFNELGYKNLSLDKAVECKIHGVSPQTIEEFNDMGFKNIPIDQVVELKIHGVTPSFIQRAQKKGMNNLSLDEYIDLKIHGLVK